MRDFCCQIVLRHLELTKKTLLKTRCNTALASPRKNRSFERVCETSHGESTRNYERRKFVLIFFYSVGDGISDLNGALYMYNVYNNIS